LLDWNLTFEASGHCTVDILDGPIAGDVERAWNLKPEVGHVLSAHLVAMMKDLRLQLRKTCLRRHDRDGEQCDRESWETKRHAVIRERGTGSVNDMRHSGACT